MAKKRKVGIVGSEAAKFTKAGERKAKLIIRKILQNFNIVEVVSGGCHLGGIDQWAADIARELKIPVTEFLPKSHNWAHGYKPRNLKIAERSDEVHCITVKELPEDYSGMRFKLCYHCGVKTHVKSGGCWTMKQAIQLGKRGVLHVVENYRVPDVKVG